MAKIDNPITFADAFNVKAADLRAAAVMNPTLAVDVKLFIDPLLLRSSSVDEVRLDGARVFDEYFGELVKLLRSVKQVGDPAWKAALKRFEFHEVPGTCLGYGGGTIRGSGFGVALSSRLLETARQIVALGVEDPTLFPLLALIEEGVGADLISDMTTNVILEPLARLTTRVCRELGVPTETFRIGEVVAQLPRNPVQDDVPVVLVPQDVLRDLPIARDWDEVSYAAAANAELRDRVNKQISHLFERASKRDKAKLRDSALSSREAFETLVRAVKAVPSEPYPLDEDPNGELAWAEAGSRYAAAHPLHLITPSTSKDAIEVVREILERFRQLVESNGLAHELWSNGKPRHERSAQRIFFAVAFAYCEANNLDVTPEADAGAGPVDFKFSSGFECRVLVEIKLSRNTRLVHGYTKQIEAYKKAELTPYAFFVVIDVGKLGKKDLKLTALRNQALADGVTPAELVFIDGNVKPSATKR